MSCGIQFLYISVLSRRDFFKQYIYIYNWLVRIYLKWKNIFYIVLLCEKGITVWHFQFKKKQIHYKKKKIKKIVNNNLPILLSKCIIDQLLFNTKLRIFLTACILARTYYLVMRWRWGLFLLDLHVLCTFYYYVNSTN